MVNSTTRRSSRIAGLVCVGALLTVTTSGCDKILGAFLYAAAVVVHAAAEAEHHSDHHYRHHTHTDHCGHDVSVRPGPAERDAARERATDGPAGWRALPPLESQATTVAYRPNARAGTRAGTEPVNCPECAREQEAHHTARTDIGEVDHGAY